MSTTLVRPAPTGGSAPVAALRRRLLVSAGLTVPVVAVSAVPALQFPQSPWVALALAGVVACWGGLPLARAGWAGLRRGVPTADAFVTLAVLATLAWSLAGALTGSPTAGAGVVAAMTTLGLAGRLAEAWSGSRLSGRVAAVVGSAGIPAAVSTLGFWLGTDAPRLSAFGAAVAVLVVACPCALTLAAPAALLAAARSGQGPATLQQLARVDTVVLTESTVLEPQRLRLHAAHTTQGVGTGEALRLAGAIGRAAQDPLLQAVAELADGPLPEAAEFDEITDVGARGIVAEVVSRDSVDTVVAHAVLVGRPELLGLHGIALPADLDRACANAEATGHPVVAVAWDGVARAVFVLGAAVRATARDTVRGLRALGLTPVLLAGDGLPGGRVVAARFGLDPDAVAEGDEAVRRLREEGRVVATIDGEILATLDGELPGEVAGAGNAVETFRLARRTSAAIRVNLTVAGAASAVALPFAAAGVLDPALAAAVVVAAATVVLAGGLRLHRIGFTGG